MARPRDHQGFQDMNEAHNLGALQVQPGETALSMMGQVIVAQRIIVKRNIETVKERIAASAAFAGDRYIYSWKVKNRRKGTEELIEGPTIKLANDIARAWGNCGVDVRVFDNGDHFMFYARFSDYETGFQLTRAFQQRKTQSFGMEDSGRALDIVLQIGQSKAIRNVIVNALSDVTEYAMEEGRRCLVKAFDSEEKRKKAWAFITKVMTAEDIEDPRVERVFGKRFENFGIRDLALLYKQMVGVNDGLIDPDDAWPREVAPGTTKEEPEQKVADTNDPNAPAGRPPRTEQGAGDSPAGNAPQVSDGATNAAATTPSTGAATQPQGGAPSVTEPQKRGRGRPRKEDATPMNQPQGEGARPPANPPPPPREAPPASQRQQAPAPSEDPFANME